MSQTRQASMLEAFANVAVGYWVAVGANAVVLPMFGIYTSLKQDMAMGLIFTVISLVRSYCLRRVFNWLSGRGCS